MPPWNNSTLTVYHGCDINSAHTLCQPTPKVSPNSINLSLCSPSTDFGQGFYSTTRQDQAENWANVRIMRTGYNIAAAVVAFDIDREALSALADIAFVWEGQPPNSDFWDLVDHCRKGNHHARSTIASGFYDLVYGPVALPNQRLVVKDCDQISFHSAAAIAVLSNPRVVVTGTPTI